MPSDRVTWHPPFYGAFFMLKTLIVIISKWNLDDQFDRLRDNMNRAGIGVVNYFPEDTSGDAYCITDSRGMADLALGLGIGVAVYLNEISRGADFGDILYGIENASLLSGENVNRMHERFQGIPWTILKTERTLIREMTEADLDAIYGIFDSPEVSRYTEGPFEDPAAELQYIKDYIRNQYHFFEYGLWMVEDENGQVIGKAGIATREGFEDPEIGYVFKSACWGQGYATEVLSAVCRYARDELELKRLNAFVIAENTASVRLLTKLGFQVYGEANLQKIRHIWYKIDLK